MSFTSNVSYYNTGFQSVRQTWSVNCESWLWTRWHIFLDPYFHSLRISLWCLSRVTSTAYNCRTCLRIIRFLGFLQYQINPVIVVSTNRSCWYSGAKVANILHRHPWLSCTIHSLCDLLMSLTKIKQREDLCVPSALVKISLKCTFGWSTDAKISGYVVQRRIITVCYL